MGITVILAKGEMQEKKNEKDWRILLNRTGHGGFCRSREGMGNIFEWNWAWWFLHIEKRNGEYC